MTDEVPDLKTIQAIREIKKIILDNDLMIFATICSEERSHWIYEVDPSWSGLSITETGPSTDAMAGPIAIRFRAKRRDFKTKEQHQRVVENTISAIFAARDQAARNHKMLQQICDIMSEHFEIDHTPDVDRRHDI